ncbi:uncharacterized protein LOC122060020 isoform X1 [Macadamia integrifolia]|uniref:uncharacterized protein LOC122060020 isoform X1 n=1 Tax=Macadamia integrifolia TaxID=60698 RepID=UPI001C5342DD|nr:uncharacterized protein LOC122060020 isoform X1 [Macadamia integrifolia]XP_042479079.1 uncharacterized protein LOC122060020 isoform X1 [Macadamia integrifolia]XP_042479080.1 uncharacterized protein LOC122060020 isoform X1 [Macadamia integrifolia]XP_042479081.1 uncharacterized protein LOC122060020 isoform X1 [Macadamia integrifolia]XP_042479082.1 uncharacterized protein LOC122060020 isoform X1 [Macadamia integrifolia]XP_042479083.1 uncharacterized protein LOC122060020 isoform X1 [Macadamia i
MLEAEVCSSRVLCPFREESGDEELSVLPRHTKVIVTGNNRTKSVLVGLQGVVKKAVGLGGWHWLVLKNGVEVKLQRNALSVLEPPTGNEEDDDDHDLDNSSSSDMGFCHASPWAASSIQFHRSSKPRVRHTRPCISAKSINRSHCREIQSNIHKPQLRVNLAKLGTNSLWRYWKRFNLARNNLLHPSREQMVDAVTRHFSSQKLDEIEVIVGFIHAAKKLKAMDS